ncbi:uncharacterized protein METZ01_LOCUS149075 [marine metagenome]|uniref:Uncharacterized protein n=1 Tax=marine metagenome TaxID=408172 RepID=A0A382A4P9_9ZZZZ
MMTGSPSLACPINIDAAEASSSVIPTSVVSKVLSYKSFLPLRSDNTVTPLEPIAMPTMPFLQALPALSFIITPTDLLNSRDKSFFKLLALLSGFSGSNKTLGLVESVSIFDLSIPAFAWMKPNLCSTTTTPFL